MEWDKQGMLGWAGLGWAGRVQGGGGGWGECGRSNSYLMTWNRHDDLSRFSVLCKLQAPVVAIAGYTAAAGWEGGCQSGTPGSAAHLIGLISGRFTTGGGGRVHFTDLASWDLHTRVRAQSDVP